MSKFLKLIEENKPGEGPFTVEYKDKDGNLMATVTLPNDVGSSYENFLKFAEESGGHLSVEDNEQIAVNYCNREGKTEEQFNPNGSIKNIAGIFNKEKNVLGMMPHPERMIDSSLSGEDGSLFFNNLINNLK